MLDLNDPKWSEQKRKMRLECYEWMTKPHLEYFTLYFDNNIDVRLCAKNGCTTLKHLRFLMDGKDPKTLQQILDDEKHLEEILSLSRYGVNQRKRSHDRYDRLAQLDHVTKHSFQFRKDSYRIAVKRDPIERAISSATYVFSRFTGHYNPNLNDIINILNNFRIHENNHYMPQFMYMGSPKMYDEVYDIKDLNKLTGYLIKNKDEKTSFYPEFFNGHKNASANKFTRDDLPHKTIERIKHIYAIDYALGWC